MASELPGATSLYTDLSNQISDTLARASGGDLGLFQDQLKDLTDSAGVLSVTAGIDGAEAGSTLDRLLNGGLTLAGLRNLRLGEQNPRLLALLEESLGGQEMADLHLEDRVTLLNDVLNRAIPDEALEAMRGSAASALEGIKTSLFDQNIGLFGWLRGLTEFDNRNAYEILGEAMGAVLDLGSSAGDLLGRLGFQGTDPMVIVGRVLETVERYADRAKGFLDGLNGLSLGSLGSLDLDPMAIARDLAGWTSAAFDRLGVFLAGMDWSNAGTVLGQGIVRVTEVISEFFLSLDYGAILGTVLQAIVGMTQALWAAFAEIREGGRELILSAGSRAIQGLVQAISEGIQALGRRLWEAISQINPLGFLQDRGAIAGPSNGRTPGSGSNGNTGGPGGLPSGEPVGLPQSTQRLPQVETSRASRRETVKAPQTINLTTQTILDGQVLYEKTTQHALGEISRVWEDIQADQLGMAPG